MKNKNEKKLLIVIGFFLAFYFAFCIFVAVQCERFPHDFSSAMQKALKDGKVPNIALDSSFMHNKDSIINIIKNDSTLITNTIMNDSIVIIILNKASPNKK